MESRAHKTDNTIGIIVTILLHILLLLALWFLVMPPLELDPPLPPPIELELEMGGMTSGGNNNAVQDEASSKQTTQANSSPSSAEKVMTATQGADSKPSGEAPKENTSAQTTPKPSINQSALMGKPSSSGSSGSGAGSMGQSGGDGQGPGGPDKMGIRGSNGINLHGLDGRGFREKPGPINKDAIHEEGTVVVQIKVNQAGNVVEAITEGFKIPNGIPKTTITDPAQKATARNEAMKYKFTQSDKGFVETGYIVYTFKFRN